MSLAQVWNDVDCDRQLYYFVCNHPDSTINPTPSPTISPTDAIQLLNEIGNIYFGYYSVHGINFNNANIECINRHGTTLASIHNSINNVQVCLCAYMLTKK